MILAFILNFIYSAVMNLNAHSFDLNLDTNNYLLCFMSFMGSANHFFPILDAYVPIFVLYVTIYTTMTVVKIAEIIINVLRGSGVKL